MNNKNKILNKVIGIGIIFVLITLSFTVAGIDIVTDKRKY